MISAAFAQWTLQFNNKELNDEYIEYNRTKGLIYFRIICLIIVLQTIIILVDSIMEEANSSYIIILSVLIGVLLLGGISVNKFRKYELFFFLTLYVLFQVISFFIGSNNLNEKYYIGFCVGIISNILLQFLTINVKMLIISILTPIKIILLVSLGQSQVTSTLYQLLTQIILLIFCHKYEQMQRTIFCLELERNKQNKLLNEGISQSLFIMTLNERSQQFQMEFSNNAARINLGITDSESMKMICRNTYFQGAKSVLDLNNLCLNRSSDFSLRKQLGTKKQNLEEYSFNLINASTYKDDLLKNNKKIDEHQHKTMNVRLIIQSKGIDKTLLLTIIESFISKKALIVLMEEEKSGNAMEKANQQVKYLNRIIQNILKEMTASQISQFKLLQNVGLSQMTQQKLKNLQSLNLSILNQYYNYQLFLKQENIVSQASRFKLIKLHSFLTDLGSNFSSMATGMNKIFKLQLIFPQNLIVRTNDKFLIQILINLIEQAFQLSKKRSVITLIVQLEQRLNPLSNYSNKNPIESEQQEQIKDLDQIPQFEFYEMEDHQDSHDKMLNSQYIKQQLIEFQILYSCKKIIQQQEQPIILNPQNAQQFMHNNYADFNIRDPITKSLIDKIGPYSDYQFQQKEINEIQHTTKSNDNSYFPPIQNLFNNKPIKKYFTNSVRFYAYADQSQLSMSFFKAVQQKTFLQF